MSPVATAHTPAQPAPDAPAALSAALAHLAASEAALAAALRAPGTGRGTGPASDRATDAGDAAPAAPGPGALALMATLADHRLRPWAEQRPWTLVGLAAVAGALLASPRGRGLVGAVAVAALLPPPPGRLGPRALGRGLAMLLSPRSPRAERRP
jgi:hypothetical protein